MRNPREHTIPRKLFDPQKGDQVSGPLEEKATQSPEWEGKAQTRNTDMQFRSEL